ncbi:hypothetical protein lerEdw1_008784 [Lerista edwardsae]|nr:hypothetical protein lerEdw1_008784 [Lerista edwardsae]
MRTWSKLVRVVRKDIIRTCAAHRAKRKRQRSPSASSASELPPSSSSNEAHTSPFHQGEVRAKASMSKSAVKISSDLLSNPLCEQDPKFLEMVTALDTAMKRMDSFNQEKVSSQGGGSKVG